MDKTGDEGARFQHDVLLHMLVKLGHRLQIGAMAVRATLGSRHRHDLVNALGLGPLPRGMAHRSAALFALGRGAVRGRDRGSFAPFELAAVQGVELGLQLLVLQFQLLGAAAAPVQLLVEFFQLIFVVAFRAGDLLIAMKDPARGQALPDTGTHPGKGNKSRRAGP